MKTHHALTARSLFADPGRRDFLKRVSAGAAALSMISATGPTIFAQTPTTAWDKKFPKSDRVNHQKVSFRNQLGITLLADLYTPKNVDRSRRRSALIVGHPFGGVKEQTAGLYAQTMAERGFVTLAFDASYNGESGGTPHFMASPEAFVEDFSAAVDYLGLNPTVDRERIGVIGLCGGGGFSLAATEIDPRIKALATVSLYDIGQSMRQGLAEAPDVAAVKSALGAIAAQRWVQVDGGATAKAIGVVDPLTDRSTDVEREFHDYYRTARGQHPRSTNEFTVMSGAPMRLFSAFERLEWISPRPVLFIMGEHAHSRVFSEQAFALASKPKELHVVPGAGHVDLYDKVELIPWDKLQSFFNQSMTT